MKKFFITILVFALLALVSIANAGVTLKWDASVATPSSPVDGYYVYYGTETGVYPERSDVGEATEVLNLIPILGLASDTHYFFTVRAYNTKGESGPSNEADYTTPIVITVPADVVITIEVNNN